jgi:hypothetical protein
MCGRGRVDTVLHQAVHHPAHLADGLDGYTLLKGEESQACACTSVGSRKQHASPPSLDVGRVTVPPAPFPLAPTLENKAAARCLRPVCFCCLGNEGVREEIGKIL